ncbi:MAG: hypothetical protein HC890_06340 [Chloroflexaceae bacterium]|nr:hypothetical protein [Chloroflexaceae bacterium]
MKMSFGNKILLTLLAIALSVSLVGIIWLSGLPATSAQYTVGSEAFPVLSAPRATDERSKAIFSCFPPELTINNPDRRDRFCSRLDRNEKTTSLSVPWLSATIPNSTQPKLSLRNACKPKALLPSDNCCT